MLDIDAEQKYNQNIQNENKCRICRLELNEKDFKHLKQCEFCTLDCCKDCIQAQRRYPLQPVYENAKDEAPRGRCCKVCVRKLIMNDYFKYYFESAYDERC